MTSSQRAMVRMSAAEFREIGKPAANKYGAKKTVLDGIRFDSQAEARYYAELQTRAKAGEVYEVELQPRFSLTINGELVGSYRADFQFYDATQKRMRVVDVKGVETRDFKIKKKLMRAIHKIDVEVVK